MSEGLVQSIPLPAGAEPPIRIYVNGEERQEGPDFTVEGGRVRFAVPLRPQPRLGFGRKVMLGIGIGVYGDLKGDALDVLYQSGGETRTASIALSDAESAGSSPPGS